MAACAVLGGALVVAAHAVAEGPADQPDRDAGTDQAAAAVDRVGRAEAGRDRASDDDRGGQPPTRQEQNARGFSSFTDMADVKSRRPRPAAVQPCQGEGGRAHETGVRAQGRGSDADLVARRRERALRDDAAGRSFATGYRTVSRMRILRKATGP